MIERALHARFPSSPVLFQHYTIRSRSSPNTRLICHRRFQRGSSCLSHAFRWLRCYAAFLSRRRLSRRRNPRLLVCHPLSRVLHPARSATINLRARRARSSLCAQHILHYGTAVLHYALRAFFSTSKASKKYTKFQCERQRTLHLHARPARVLHSRDSESSYTPYGRSSFEQRESSYTPPGVLHCEHRELFMLAQQAHVRLSR